MARPISYSMETLTRAMRAAYNPLGFSKGYNFILWFLTLGYLLGFTLARTIYFSFTGVFCNPHVHGINGASPGECYYYLRQPWKTGMQLHLFTILPAGILVCFQFTPWFRHHLMLFHRLNGYLVITLSLVSSAGVLIVAQVSFGGDFATRTVAGALVISTTISYIMAYINIKLLQIDQHRAWMLRCWAYFATIITIRLIMFSGGAIISLLGGWFTTRPCAQIASVVGPNGAVALYPVCDAWRNGSAPEQRAIVEANYPGGNPLEISAALGITFGAAGWLALWLHAIAVEIYLRLTPAESDRLRQASYEKQLKRGWKTAGYSGLVAERFGDANPYKPLAFLENDGRVDGTTLAVKKRSSTNEDSPA